MNLTTLISRALSPLSLGEGPGVRLLFLLLLFSSCAKDHVPEPAATVTTGRTVRREVTVQAAPMQGMQGRGATRVTTQVPLNEDEARIHSLWVLQFGGTTGASRLIKKAEVDVNTINPVTGGFCFDFEELAAGGQVKVYLLANFPASALSEFTENGVTLEAFEAGNLRVTPLTEAAMQAEGLPMVGAQSFDYASENPAPFALKSLLAKVSFRYATINGYAFAGANLSACNLASAVPVRELSAGAAVQHPAGIDYGGELTIVGDFTYKAEDGAKVCYLPENLSGQVAALTQASERGGSNAPGGAACMKMTNGNLGATLYSFYVGDGTAKDFNMKRHNSYTFDMKLKGANRDDKRIEKKTANCYIVTAGGNYVFDASRPGNDSDVSGITKPTNLTTATEARVLWQTGAAVGAANAVVKSVEYDQANHLVRFTTGSATEGNAVIGIFASGAEDAPCLWSWHIWRLPSAPGTKTFNKTSATTGGTVAVTMMDRNLGAYNNTINDVKAIGLLYQWGRKDPFPGPAGFNATEPNIYGSLYAGGGVKTFNGAYTIPAVKSDATTGTINYAIQYPGAFIYQGPSNDWLQTKDDNLWGTPWEGGGTNYYNKNQGTKSIYDPCPPGYRVPLQDTWNLQTAAGTWSNGMTMDKLGNFWFPAAGSRLGNTSAGVLNYGSNYGFYWSSSSYDGMNAHGGRLYFYKGKVYTRDGTSRAYANSVRCVSE